MLQNKLLLAHLKKSGVEIHWHGREDGEPTPCCNNCMDEVFNILFVLNCRGEYLVYCHKCASSSLKGFTVLQQVCLVEGIYLRGWGLKGGRGSFIFVFSTTVFATELGY